jgi:phenylacetate-coenzyme A ligase PaaK-like adenylate-forming protein
MNISRFIPRLVQEYQSAAAYLRRLEDWDDRRTPDLQFASLKEIWRDCVTDVPYYAELAALGKAPKEISKWEDFYNIPELNRQLLQDFPEKFMRRSGPPDFKRMTGGSTGNPVHFGMWKSEDRVLRLLKLALWIRAGYQPDSRIFLIWGHSHLLGTGWRRHVRHLQRKLKDRLLGYRRLDAYRLNPEICRAMARECLSFRPAGLIGYASALDYFVRATPEFAEAFGKCGCRFVQPAAEPLPKPDSRELLCRTFNCQLIEEFGGVDFGQVAMRLDDGFFEVFPEHNILETRVATNDGGTEEAALVTTLYRRYTPLIRYRQGDALAGAVKLAHGHVSRFARLDGRCNDMIRLDSGSTIHSVAVFHCIHQEPGVLNIQLVLENRGTTLRLVTTPDFDQNAERRIRQRLGQVAAELSECVFERVSDVETSRAGKRRWFVDKRFVSGSPGKS